jgi:hypothetical protein
VAGRLRGLVSTVRSHGLEPARRARFAAANVFFLTITIYIVLKQ